MAVRKSGVALEVQGLAAYIGDLGQATAANQGFAASALRITAAGANITTALTGIANATTQLNNLNQVAAGVSNLSTALDALKNVAPIGVQARSLANGLTTLSTAINQVGGQNINGTVAGLNQIVGTLQNLGNASQGIQNLRALGNINLGNLSGGLGNIGGGANIGKGFGASILSGIGSALSGAKNLLQNGVFGTLSNIGSFIGKNILSGLTSIASAAGGVINSVVSKLSFGLVSNFTGLIGSIASSLPGVLGTVFTGITRSIGFIASGVSSLVSNIVSGIGAAARGVVSVVSSIASGIGTVASGIATVVSSIVSGIGSAVSGIGSFISSAIGAIAAPISAIASSLGANFGQIFAFAAGDLIASAIKGAINLGIEAGQALFSAAKFVINVGVEYQQALADIEAGLSLIKPELSPSLGTFDPAVANQLRDTINSISIDPNLVVDFTEAAQQAQLLTRYGFSVQQVTDGGLRSAVLLQNSIGGSYNLAAEVLAKYQQIANVPNEKLGDAASQIAATTVVGGFKDLNDYRYALVNSSGALQVLGADQTDVNTILAVTNKLFASGRTDGTGFRTFVEGLVPTTDKAAEGMARLNLKFFDANKKFIGIQPAITELRNAFKGLTQEEQIYNAETIFGKTGGKFLLTLLSETTDATIEQTKAIIKNADAQTAASIRAGTLGERYKNLKGQLEAIFASLFPKSAQDQIAKPIGAIQDALLKIGPLATNFGEGLAVAIGPASEKLAAFIKNLTETGKAFGTFNIADILKGFGKIDLADGLFGGGLDLGKLHIVGGLDLGNQIAASIGLDKIFKITAGFNFKDLIGVGGINIGDFLNITGSIDLKKYIGTVDLGIKDFLTLSGSIDLKDKIGNVVLGIKDFLTLSGSIDLKDKIAAVAFDIKNFLSLSGSIDLSKYIANFSLDLGKLSIAGSLSGKGATLDLNGIEFKLGTDKLAQIGANLEAAFTPVLGFFSNIGTKLAGALGFTQTLTPALDGLNSISASTPDKKIVDLGDFLLKASEIPLKIENAFSTLTIPNITATLSEKLKTIGDNILAAVEALVIPDFTIGLKERLSNAFGALTGGSAGQKTSVGPTGSAIPTTSSSGFTLPTFELPNLSTFIGSLSSIPKQINDALAPFTANINITSITDNFNKLAAAVGLANFAITTAGSDTGALGQIRKLITDTVTNIGDSINKVDPTKAISLGASISTTITTIVDSLTNLSNIGNANVAVAVSSISDLSTGLLNFATGVTKGFNGKEIGASSVNFVKSFIDEFAIALSPENLKAVDIAKAASGFVLAISDQFKSALAPGNLTGLGESIGTLTSTLITQISGVLSNPQFAGQLGESFSNILVGITQGLSDVLAGFNSKTDNELQNAQIQGGISGFITNFLQGVATGLANADYGSVVQSFVQNLFKSLLGGPQVAADLDVISKEGASFQNIFKLLKDINELGGTNPFVAAGASVAGASPTTGNVRPSGTAGGGAGGFGGADEAPKNQNFIPSNQLTQPVQPIQQGPQRTPEQQALIDSQRPQPTHATRQEIVDKVAGTFAETNKGSDQIRSFLGELTGANAIFTNLRNVVADRTAITPPPNAGPQASGNFSSDIDALNAKALAAANSLGVLADAPKGNNFGNEVNASAITNAGRSTGQPGPTDPLGATSVELGQQAATNSLSLATTLSDAAAAVSSFATSVNDASAQIATPTSRQNYQNFIAANNSGGAGAPTAGLQDATEFSTLLSNLNKLAQPVGTNTGSGGGAGGFGETKIDTSKVATTLETGANTASENFKAAGSTVNTAALGASANLKTVSFFPGWPTLVGPPADLPEKVPLLNWDDYIVGVNLATRLPLPSGNQNNNQDLPVDASSAGRNTVAPTVDLPSTTVQPQQVIQPTAATVQPAQVVQPVQQDTSFAPASDLFAQTVTIKATNASLDQPVQVIQPTAEKTQVVQPTAIPQVTPVAATPQTPISEGANIPSVAPAIETASTTIQSGATAASASFTAAGTTVETGATAASASFTAAGTTVQGAATTAASNLASVELFPGWPTLVGPPADLPGKVSKLDWGDYIIGVNLANQAPSTRNALGFAGGTDSVPKTGRYLVGEDGPETVILKQGSAVIPADETAKMQKTLGAYAEGTLNSTNNFLNSLSKPPTQVKVAVSVDNSQAKTTTAALPGGPTPPIGPQLAPIVAPEPVISDKTKTQINQDLTDTTDKIKQTLEGFSGTITDLEGDIKAVPGLLNASPVTKEQLDNAAAGGQNIFADDFVRQLGAEVANNNQEFGGLLGKATEALTKIGLTPAGTPEGILAQIKSTFASGQLFSDKAGNTVNTELINTEAIKQSVALQEQQKAGQANLLSFAESLFGAAGAAVFNGASEAASGKTKNKNNTVLGAADSTVAGTGITKFPGWTGKDGVIPTFPKWKDKDGIIQPFPGWSDTDGGFIPDLDWAVFIPELNKKGPAGTGTPDTGTTPTTGATQGTGKTPATTKGKATGSLGFTGTTVVGETGPELATMNRSTRIIPAQNTERILNVAGEIARALPTVNTDPRNLLGGSSVTVLINNQGVSGTVLSALDEITTPVTNAAMMSTRASYNTGLAVVNNSNQLTDAAIINLNKVSREAITTAKDAADAATVSSLAATTAAQTAADSVSSGSNNSNNSNGQIVGGPPIPVTVNANIADALNRGSSAGFSQGISTVPQNPDGVTTSPRTSIGGSAGPSQGSGAIPTNPDGGVASPSSVAATSNRVSQPQTTIIIRPAPSQNRSSVVNKSYNLSVTTQQSTGNVIRDFQHMSVLAGL